MCTPVGPGCDNCYASAWAKRTGRGEYRQGVPRVRTTEENWKQPIKWNRKAQDAGVRRRVFCASLADVFDNEVPDEWRADLMKLIVQTTNLSWLLVTKRIGNVERMLAEAGDLIDYGEGWQSMWGQGSWPDNVRLLITVCNQKEADRDVPKLLALPCKNGISYEPALGPVDWTPWLSPKAHINWGRNKHPSEADQRAALEWIIVGGESTQGAGKARPFDLAWARSTIAQCRAAGVPAFVKQLGSHPVEDVRLHGFAPWSIKDRAGADPAEWPEDLRVQECPT